MGVNNDKPHLWKDDIAKSVDMYNDWFMRFAPTTFRSTRKEVTKEVQDTLKITRNLTHINPEILKKYPKILPTLRMSTCPPIAVDRLIGLSKASPNLVRKMENENKLPERMSNSELIEELNKIGSIIQRMADPDIFVWMGRETPPDETEIYRAATIVADRLCGSVANPIIRNAQEKRQLANIKSWLESRGYKQIIEERSTEFKRMKPGTFTFRLNVSVDMDDGKKTVNIPIDAVIMPKTAKGGDFPVFIEAKSAGDFTNVNKRRKEEAIKIAQLKRTYGSKIRFYLFLCGYFDSGYLGYEAAEGIDWVWEHRMGDFEKFGL